MSPSDGSESDREIVTREGWRLRLRSVEDNDAPTLIEMNRLSTPDDRRLRFFTAVRPDLGPLAYLLSHYDHDRQIAVGAYDPAAEGGRQHFLGVVRLVLSEDGTRGDYAVMVRSDIKGHGLGYCLMQEMLCWAVARGLRQVDGEVLVENTGMLHMVHDLGGVTSRSGDDFHTVKVRFDIAGESH